MTKYFLKTLTLSCLVTFAFSQEGKADCKACWTEAAMPITKCITNNIQKPTTVDLAKECVDAQIDALRMCLTTNKCKDELTTN